MPAPLPASISGDIRQGVTGTQIAPPFRPNPVPGQAVLGSAGIPIAGFGNTLEWKASYEYALAATCPEVIDLDYVSDLGSYRVDVVLDSSAFCGFFVQKLPSLDLYKTFIRMSQRRRHRFFVNMPTGSYRLIGVSSPAVLADIELPLSLGGCEPSASSVTTSLAGTVLTVNANLDNPGGVLAILTVPNSDIVVSSQIITTSATAHVLALFKPSGNFRLRVWGLGVPLILDT